MHFENARERIFCAVDTTDTGEAESLAAGLRGMVGGLKIGKEYFTATGPQGLRKLAAEGHRIFLDLKFHDIPNTVAGAVKSAIGLGCAMLTVHASGGPAMLRAAAETAASAGARRPLILAVTVLTSLDDSDLAAVGQVGPAADQVLRLARLARDCGADGIVCSPNEISLLRKELGPDLLLVTPGIRPAWTASDDQKRITTPADAVSRGASYLVIGRPITRAADPAEAARRIAAEIEDDATLP